MDENYFTVEELEFIHSVFLTSLKYYGSMACQTRFGAEKQAEFIKLALNIDRKAKALAEIIE